MNVVEPTYNSDKEWKMDPKGYCIIKVFYSEGYVGVRHYTPEGKETTEIKGTNSYVIVQTLIREGLITTLPHAAYLGHELHKATTALDRKIKYVQDAKLDYDQPFTHDPSQNVEESQS